MSLVIVRHTEIVSHTEVVTTSAPSLYFCSGTKQKMCYVERRSHTRCLLLLRWELVSAAFSSCTSSQFCVMCSRSIVINHSKGIPQLVVAHWYCPLLPYNGCCKCICTLHDYGWINTPISQSVHEWLTSRLPFIAFQSDPMHPQAECLYAQFHLLHLQRIAAQTSVSWGQQTVVNSCLSCCQLSGRVLMAGLIGLPHALMIGIP